MDYYFFQSLVKQSIANDTFEIPALSKLSTHGYIDI